MGTEKVIVPLVPTGMYFKASVDDPEVGRPAKNSPIQSLEPWVLGADHETVTVPPGATVVGITLRV